tara:strand:+ start:2546 stop:3631 length:1086 start_codon:yes stop_codon:yes gene_type:complete
VKRKSKGSSLQLDLLNNTENATTHVWSPPQRSIRSNHLSPAKVTAVYDAYWYFAFERQNIFFNRINRTNGPWTRDPILSEFKFTNAYRAADRVSQYLIRHVIYRDDLPNNAGEIFFRIILFKLFNKIETWERLERDLGPLVFEDYDFDAYDAVLMSLKAAGNSIYSGAYIMHPGSSAFQKKFKHQNHLKLLELMMAEELPDRIADTRRMQDGFELLLEYPTIGDFLAYQFVTDLNYSELTDYSEMEFVVPGPGALDGIKKCFSNLGGLNTAEIIRFVADIQEQEFERLELDFQNLWGRRLQLIDCQNLFCEISKYSRVSHPHISGTSDRKRIKQKFSENDKPIEYWFPPKWGITTGGSDEV